MDNKSKNTAQFSGKSAKHPCRGCIWYVRDTDVLFCPFHNCVRDKKGFEFGYKGGKKC
jgi:hypothetical protein